MGKRSPGTFERNPRDWYPTPYEAVLPLIPHLTGRDQDYIEPCAGDGTLVSHLSGLGYRCRQYSDIEPQAPFVGRRDALTAEFPYGATAITNPPWDRKILHPLIERLSDRGQTWLLFDADWMHTKQAIPYLPRLRKVVSVGRVKWIPDSKMTGKDNCAWHLFTAPSDEPTQFYGRQP